MPAVGAIIHLCFSLPGGLAKTQMRDKRHRARAAAASVSELLFTWQAQGVRKRPQMGVGAVQREVRSTCGELFASGNERVI